MSFFTYCRYRLWQDDPNRQAENRHKRDDHETEKNKKSSPIGKKLNQHFGTLGFPDTQPYTKNQKSQTHHPSFV